MEYSNKEILTAVLSKWIEPLLSTIANTTTTNLPFISNLESKIKASGWVNPNWSLMNELLPFTKSIVKASITPMIDKTLSSVDDALIPLFAHLLVLEALLKESLTFLDGKITFSREDLKTLKNLLDWNLPVTAPIYKVKENEL